MQEREPGLSTRDLAGGATVDRPEEPATDATVDRTDERVGDRAADEAPDTRDDRAAATDEMASGRGDEGQDARDHRAASTDEMASGRRDEPDALLPADVNADFQGRWENLQTGFVDEPRLTVEQADQLVAEVMQRLAEGFAAERERLEQQWGRGEDISTEDLRITLQRYRAFFQRLLSA